jgi:hypothetical protein
VSGLEPLLEFMHRARAAQEAINKVIADNGYTDASLNAAEAIVDDLEVLAVAQAARLFERTYHHTPTLSELLVWARESYRPNLAGFLESGSHSDRIKELLADE